MEMAAFWVVTPCSLVEVYRRSCCLHHQGDQVNIALMMEAESTSETSTRIHGAATQKTATFTESFIRMLLGTIFPKYTHKIEAKFYETHAGNQLVEFLKCIQQNSSLITSVNL
jgi:hypothetical protein